MATTLVTPSLASSEHLLEVVYRPSPGPGLRFDVMCAACRERYSTVTAGEDCPQLKREIEKALSRVRQALFGDACPVF